MTEYQYIENRLKDILNNLAKSNLSLKYRINQENALKFYASELKKFRKINLINTNKNYYPTVDSDTSLDSNI